MFSLASLLVMTFVDPTTATNDALREVGAHRPYDIVATSADALSCVNPAHALAVRFEADGITIQRREDVSRPERPSWRIALVGYGRTNAMRRVTSVRPCAEGNRVEFRRDDITEWYVNDARGIEQGFTLASRPAGLEESSLLIECEVSGSLVGATTREGFEFSNADRSFVLGYGGLFAVDSLGRELPASMTLVGTRLRLVVEDRDACYPVIVDPLTFDPQWSANGGGGTDFGSSVASAGDVDGDGYGDVLVGARSFSNGQSWEGAARLYRGGPSGLSSTPAWTAEGNVSFAFYGSEVAGAGDLNADGYDDVAVATRGHLDGSTSHARCYVYLGSASGLAASAAAVIEIPSVSPSTYLELTAVGDATQDGFGDLLIGVSQSSPQRVYLYRGTAMGLESTPAQTILAPQAGSSFGRSLDAAGDLNGDGRLDVVVGAPTYASGQTNEGAVYAFLGTSNAFAPTPVWQVESDVTNALFGQSVAGAGDFDSDGFADVVVGAPYHSAPLFQEGRAYAYRGSVTGPLTTIAWSDHPEVAGSLFGSSVAGPGDVDGDGFDDVLVGAEGTSSGRLKVYLGGATGLESVAAWTSKQASYLGQSADGAGDVNGDGYPDVVGGGSNSDSGTEGAQVYHGGPFGSWSPYGVGKKAGSPNLITEAPAVIGQIAALRCFGGKPLAAPFLFLGTEPVALPFDLTTLYVVPVTTLSFTTLDLNGHGFLPLGVPSSPSLVGVSAFFQLGYVDPAAPGPYHTRLSNGVRWWIGS